MPDQIPEGITREDVLSGINDFQKGVSHSFKDSTGYDLLFEDERFPPKAILGLSATRLNGKPLKPKDFSGGEDSKCFRILRELGFKIVVKIDKTSNWILQGNPNNFAIDTYLKDFDYVYWSVPIKKYREEINVGDRVFFWRASGRSKSIAGIIGSGVVSEECKPMNQVDHPDLIDPGISAEKSSLWSEESEPKSSFKVGVRKHIVRLTPDQGMLTRDELVGASEFSKNQIMTVRQGSVFPMSDDEFSFIQSLWNGVGETLIRKEFKEGSVRQIISKRYERNPKAKAECLNHFGYDCQGCGMNFEKTYGEVGKNFIHVHHVIPISKKEGSYDIDPVKDLIPLCPNCHSVVHRRKDPYTIEELKQFLATTNSLSHL